MPTVHNWEDWEEIEEQTNDELTRNRVKKSEKKNGTGSDRGWKGPQKTLSPEYRKEKSKK